MLFLTRIHQRYKGKQFQPTSAATRLKREYSVTRTDTYPAVQLQLQEINTTKTRSLIRSPFSSNYTQKAPYHRRKVQPQKLDHSSLINMAKANINLIDEVDAFPYAETDPDAFAKMNEGLYTLVWEDSQGTYPIGYVLDRVVKELHQVPEDIRGKMVCDEVERTILLFQEPTEEERTRRVATLADYWRQNGTFPLLRGWRNELWPVYARTGELLFSMERAAMGLIGTMRYGVHMVAYVKDKTAPHGLRLWVPTRARNKSTFPSMLDNTVAGGLMTGEDPFECVIREADEEASLPDSIVRKNAKFVGNVTYIYITDEGHVGEGDFIYPECQWVYHLELSNDVIPQPSDGEAERFDLCDVDQVKADLAAGRFKPNCALVTIDFFIRHGILTDENEPEIKQIKQRIRRNIPFPGPHRSDWRPL